MKFENLVYLCGFILLSNFFLLAAFRGRTVQMIGEFGDKELLQEIASRSDLRQDHAFSSDIVYYRDLTLFENIRDYVICNLLMLAVGIFAIKYDERNNLKNDL